MILKCNILLFCYYSRTVKCGISDHFYGKFMLTSKSFLFSKSWHLLIIKICFPWSLFITMFYYKSISFFMKKINQDIFLFHRSLDRDLYDHITATYYLLAERKLKRHHQEMALAQIRKHSAPADHSSPAHSLKPNLELSLSPRYGTHQWLENIHIV